VIINSNNKTRDADMTQLINYFSHTPIHTYWSNIQLKDGEINE